MSESDSSAVFKRLTLVATIVLIGMVVLNGQVGSAETIDWVTWTPSASPGTTSTGAGSGLTVDANWTVRTNIQFENRTINVLDADWPFTNTDVVHMWLSQAGTVPYNNATIDFTNVGGLAAGGSIGFVDIDNLSTNFQITAYVSDGQGGYVLQPVNWTYTTFVSRAGDPPPAWNPSTNTISGTGGGADVFAFLTGDARIDRIQLNGQTVNDGWGFAASSTAVVPEPASLALLGLGSVGLMAMLRRRARRRGWKVAAAILFCLVAASLAGPTPEAQAQTSVTLDGTSGSNTTAVPYSTSGNLTVSLGFFVDYLIVGGGGGNGSGALNVAYPSGGGGGGVIAGSAFEVDANSFNLTVGAGGVAGGNGNGGDGGSSTLFGSTANGGIGPTTANPGVGGTSASGFAGGNRASGPPNGAQGGGGGGNEGTGTDGIYVVSPLTRVGGTGGVGTFSDITGTSLMYGFGGGGGAPGGNFQNGDGTTNVNARANSGGGGAGAGTGGGPGAAGTVVVRYLGSVAASGGTITSGTGTATGYTLHSYTTPGAGAFDMSAVNLDARLGTTASGLFSGTGALDFDGPGRLTLTADNTYAGTTTITAGTLQVGDGGSTGSLGAGDVINNSELVVNRAGTLLIAGTVSGTGTLVKDGAGTLVLSGTNTYTGSTTVTAGTFEVAGNSTGVTGGLTVGTGSTLAGSGTLGGSTAVQGGGILSPGSGSASLGILSLSDLALNASATTLIQITDTGATPGTDFDQISILGGGPLGFAGTLDLSTSNIDTAAVGTAYRLFDFTSTPSGGFATITPLSGNYSSIAWGSPVSGVWTSSAIVGGNYLTFDEGTGTLAVVPEPATLLSCGIGGAAALVVACRRRYASRRS